MHLKPYANTPIFSERSTFSPTRIRALIGVVLCLGALGFGYYLEHRQYIQPCPLCILQRGIYLLLALLFLIWAIPREMSIWLSRSLAFLTTFSAILGIALAGRQVWLEHLPPGEAPLCSASLERLFEIYPVTEVFRRILTTSGECARVMFRIVGLSLAEWSLVMFEILLLVSLYQWRHINE